MSFTSPMPEAVRAERPQPEQTFFADPALDRAFGVVMALATEVWVMRDRMAAIERQLVARGALDLAALAKEPAPEEVAERTADRDAFVAHLMENLLGHATSRGAEAPSAILEPARQAARRTS